MKGNRARQQKVDSVETKRAEVLKGALELQESMRRKNVERREQ